MKNNKEIVEIAKQNVLTQQEQHAVQAAEQILKRIRQIEWKKAQFDKEIAKLNKDLENVGNEPSNEDDDY